MRPREIIEEVADKARDIPVFGGTRVYAYLMYKGRLIGEGYNRDKTHPFQLRFSTNPEAIFFHAETDAIKRALDQYPVKYLEKSTLFVARLTADNEWAMAKPCGGCMNCCEAFGIEFIYYTTGPKKFTNLSTHTMDFASSY